MWRRGGCWRAALRRPAPPQQGVSRNRGFAVPAAFRPANPRPSGWVADTTGTFGPETVAALNAQFEELHRSTSCEVAAATSSFVPRSDAESREFAVDLFNAWGVGSNGLLIVVLPEARRFELRTGRSMREVCDDAFLAQVIAETLAPRFKAGLFDAGIEAAAARIADRATRQRDNRDERRVATILLLLVIAVVLAALRLDGRDDRTCERCGITMKTRGRAALANIYDLQFEDRGFDVDATVPPLAGTLLEDLPPACRVDETRGVLVDTETGAVVASSRGLKRLPGDCAVDRRSGDIYERDPLAKKLTPCRLLERELRSAVFEDVVCPECGAEKIARDIKYFSSPYSTCEGCGCRALRESVESRRTVGGGGGGAQVVVRACSFCGKRDTSIQLLPPLEERRSRDGGGGAGGGASGGY